MENTATVDGEDFGNLGEWNGNQPLGLWDSENCPIPAGHNANILLIALRQHLQSLKFDINFKLLGVVGDVTDHNRIPPDHVDFLRSRGVEFTSAPKDAEGNVAQDAADHVILKKLVRFHASGSKVPLIVIAGDGIYQKRLKSLVAENYNVVWIYPKSKTKSKMLSNLDPCARICYEDLMWTNMQLEHIRSGSGPSPTRESLRMESKKGKEKSKKGKGKEKEGRGE